ncbi:MAG: hypothetical protein WD278_19650 [Pirellulales bacterium]
MVVKSIGVLSAGKVLGCLYVLLGLIIGAMFSLLSLAGVAAGGQDAGAAAFLFGIGAIVIIPLFYGTVGFIGGIIMAALYNVVASLAGGIELELSSTANRVQ